MSGSVLLFRVVTMQNNLRGFSLSHVLISLMLSSFILLTLFKMYALIKSNYRFQTKRLRQRQELLLVIAELRQAISHAGFSPCVNLQSIIHDQDLIGVSITHSDSPNLPPAVKKRVLKGSDVIHVSRMDYSFSTVSPLGEQTVLLNKRLDVKPKTQIVLSSCAQYQLATVARVTHLKHQTEIGFNQVIKPQLREGAYFSLLVRQWFYVGKNSRQGISFYLYEGRSEELSNKIIGLKADWYNERIVGLTLDNSQGKLGVLIGIIGL